MTPRIQVITYFKTKDGKVHETLQQAQKNDAQLQLYEWARNCSLCTRSSVEWTSDMVIDHLIADAAAVLPLLTAIAEVNTE